MIHWINLIPLAFIFIGCILFLISNKMTVVIGSVALIIMAEFVISVQFTSSFAALIRLVASMSAVFVIYISLREKQVTLNLLNSNIVLFRVVAFTIFIILAVLIAIKISDYLQISIDIILGGLFAVFCGILQLGISSTPSKVILSIILFYNGFSSIYSILESSLLINGLLSLVVILLGALGTYFVIRDVKADAK